MADLDDFFAKKDRKKSKAKKFLTADELVKNLEDTLKREHKKEPTPAVIAATDASKNSNDENNENPASGEQVGSNNSVPVADEEWKEIEVERKDYSGLKIGQLINEDELHQQDDGDGNDDDDNDGSDNYSSYESKGNGPWKKVIPAEEVTQIPMPAAAPASGGSSVYISPALRNSQNVSALRMNKLRKGTAPDITNEDYFPTLGAARPEEQKKKKNEPAFEEVRHGGRVQRVQEQTAAPVSVGNRFKSLEDDDS